MDDNARQWAASAAQGERAEAPSGRGAEEGGPALDLETPLSRLEIAVEPQVLVNLGPSPQSGHHAYTNSWRRASARRWEH